MTNYCDNFHYAGSIVYLSCYILKLANISGIWYFQIWNFLLQKSHHATRTLHVGCVLKYDLITILFIKCKEWMFYFEYSLICVLYDWHRIYMFVLSFVISGYCFEILFHHQELVDISLGICVADETWILWDTCYHTLLISFVTKLNKK